MRTYFSKQNTPKLSDLLRESDDSVSKFNYQLQELNESFNEVLIESEYRILIEDDEEAKKTFIDKIKEWLVKIKEKIVNFFKEAFNRLKDINKDIEVYAKENKQYLKDNELKLDKPIKIYKYVINGKEGTMITVKELINYTNMEHGNLGDAIIIETSKVETNKIHPSKAYKIATGFYDSIKLINDLQEILLDSLEDYNEQINGNPENVETLKKTRELLIADISSYMRVSLTTNKIAHDAKITMKKAVVIKKKETNSEK